MAKLNIAVLNGHGSTICQAGGEDEIWMVHQGTYEPGDKIIFSTDEFPDFYYIRVDGTMDEAYVYLTQKQIMYVVPFERDNPFRLEKISYAPGVFAGERHYITMRKAKLQENQNYRNLAVNVMDQHQLTGCYPHVHANAETKGQIAPLFAARNTIDGVLANTSHWPWPFQSWGIDQRADAELTVEFGRPVDIEKLRLQPGQIFPMTAGGYRERLPFPMALTRW